MSTGSAPPTYPAPQPNQPPMYAPQAPGQWGGAPGYAAGPPRSGWGARGPKVKSYWTVFVFALIAMVLIAVGIGLAWMTATGTYDGSTATGYYYIGQNECVTTSGGTSCSTPSNIPGGAYGAEALIIVGLILAILLVVFSLLGALGFLLKGLQAKLIWLSGLLSIPITLAAPFLFLGTTYSNTSFYGAGMFGSYTIDGVNISNTGGAGWYCAIVGGVILIVFLFLVRKSLAEQRAAAATWVAPVAPMAAPAYTPPQYGTAPGMAGYAPAPAPAPAPMAAPAIPVCPKCGRPATYIAQYQRYYCYTDQLYV
jgi:hypothetical protein